MRLGIAFVIGVSGFVVGLSAVAALRKRPAAASATSPPSAPAATAASLGSPDPRFVYKVVLDDAPVRGEPDAPVTIVVFGASTFASSRALDATLARLGADREVRVAWKELPEPTDRGRKAARAARAAAAQGRFWEMRGLLSTAEPAVIDDTFALRAAERLGLDLPRFRAALTGQATTRAIDADMAQARQFGLETFPAVFVNGRFVPNPSFAQLREQIDEARAFAAQLIADGTSRGEVYAALMRGALPRSGPISALSFE